MNMSLSKSITMLVLFALSFTSCSPAFVERNGHHGNTATEQYEGRTIFQGLVFGDGPVAKQFPEIWETDAVKEAVSHATVQELQSASIFKSKVMDRITDSDPNFFERFGRAMRSGDPLQVSNSLDQVAPLIQDAVKQVTQPTSGVSSLAFNGMFNGLFSLVVLATNSVSNFDSVKYSLRYVVLISAQVTFWNPGADANSKLSRDVWSSRIAQRLLAF